MVVMYTTPKATTASPTEVSQLQIARGYNYTKGSRKNTRQSLQVEAEALSTYNKLNSLVL